MAGWDAGPVDLVVVAPSPDECRDVEALRAAVVDVSGRLHPDGFLYLFAPRRFRRRLLAVLRSCGLEIGPRFLHLGRIESGSRLVSLSAPALRYAADTIVASRLSRRLAAAVLRRRPPTRALARFAPVGVVARHPGAEPLLAWLAARDSAASARNVVVARSWRPGVGSVVLTVVDDSGRPRVVAKIGASPTRARGGLDEAAALDELGPTACAAGASVPAVVWSGALGDVRVLVESAVPGRRAATVVAERPAKLAEVLDRLLEWLRRWNGLTAVEARLTDELLEQEVLAPARMVAEAVGVSPAYTEWLRARCAGLAGTEALLAASHDDLTLANVLVDGGGLGVVDWDTARPRALPLVDFFYVVVDAHLAAEAEADRVDVLVDCFSPQGRRRHTVAPWEERLAAQMHASGPVLQLAFHACWLQHAANEVVAGGGLGSFSRIARRLAAAPERVGPAAVRLQ